MKFAMDIQPTVFIVDDTKEIHVYISRVMKSVDLPVVSYYSGQTFLENYQPHQVGCLLLDLRMPGMSGLELYERLKEQQIHLPVIIMTSYGDVPTALRAMKADAFDFIEKPFVSSQFLLERVQQAIKTDVERYQNEIKRQQLLARLNTLTPREYDVMMKIIEGKSSKVIARELDISYKTVENHQTKIMKKMQVQNVVELVHIAHFCGLLPPSNDLFKDWQDS